MKLFTWIRNHLSLFKGLFLIAVAVIVLGELLSLSKTISVDQLTTLFSELAVWRVALMLLISLLCIAPMIGYDIILNRLLGQKLSARYLSETSWIINTMNNLVGFGGLSALVFAPNSMAKKKMAKMLLKQFRKFLFI